MNDNDKDYNNNKDEDDHTDDNKEELGDEDKNTNAIYIFDNSIDKWRLSAPNIQELPLLAASS